MRQAGLESIEAAKADGSWTKLEDAEKLVLPEDLAAAFAGHDSAAASYAGLTTSRRMMLLYWISGAKRPGTRADRIAKTLAALAEGRLPFA
jgi:uncharacterized protein YdeI (YjbR/CyaY-like superfamily)